MFDTTISELIVKCFTCILPTKAFLMPTTYFSPCHISRHLFLWACTNISLSPHIGLFICTTFAVVQYSIPVIFSPVIRDYTVKTKWLKYNLLVSAVARIQQLVGCSVYIHIIIYIYTRIIKNI